MTTTNQRAVEELAALVAAVAAEFTGEHTEGITEDGAPMEPDDSKVAFPEEDCHITFGHIRRAQQAITTLRTPGWRPISEEQVEAAAQSLYAEWSGARLEDTVRLWAQMFDSTREISRRLARAALSTLPPPPGEG